MKKLLLMTIVLLVSGTILAQGSAKTTATATKSVLAFHAGPSFPVGDFGSNDFDNEQAGFAKTGFTIDLNYGYQFHPNAGIAASVFYNKYNMHNVVMDIVLEGRLNEEVTLDIMDNWQFYGITAGPMLTFGLAKNIWTDLRLMGGVVNTKSPKISYEGELLEKAHWSIAPALQGGLDLRFGTGKNMFIFTNLDYLYMKPEFTASSSEWFDEGEKFKQKISVLNLTGGIGIKF